MNHRTRGGGKDENSLSHSALNNLHYVLYGVEEARPSSPVAVHSLALIATNTFIS